MQLTRENERSLMLRINAPESAELSQQLQWLVEQLQTSQALELLDCVAGFNTVLVVFDPLLTDHAAMELRLTTLLNDWQNTSVQHIGREHVIPVYYDFSPDWDLLTTAESLQITPEHLIEQHQNQRFRVCVIGFAPGFAYLGHMPDAYRIARRSTPRSRVPAGAVALAETMTAVYPTASPGGWHIIGHTPASLFQPFDLKREVPCQFRVGDSVRFERLSQRQWQDANA
ncbi:Kinase A inhibitor [BD1-7 clade bacterium]|uniref:Kinase A inhibitor n=1 Tax=BD1-7 clade bacterium TaxID=2029982 RepID=A0A5S9Q9X6_9GAMM|nr:Kinase A inhibitor [BD1-7 clade bacterium]CAA0114891.1 Kinase A inhibitor [BD1-7 clade bacterium]